MINFREFSNEECSFVHQRCKSYGLPPLSLEVKGAFL